MHSTLERIVPKSAEARSVTGDLSLDLHLERYRFASNHVAPGRVLDIACGVGYGTAFLAQTTRGRAFGIVGVDVDRDAVEYARREYGHTGATFVQSDALRFQDSEGFESIVSLETLEHVPRPDLLALHLAGMLKPGGILVCSAPVTPSVDVNPYHLTDFTQESFRALFTGLGLHEVDCLPQTQPYSLWDVLSGRESRTQDLRRNLLWYYATHPSSAVRRMAATWRYGWCNQYLTVAWRKPDR